MKHAIVDLLEGMIRLRDDAASGQIEAVIDATDIDGMTRLGDAMEAAIASLDAIPFPIEGDGETGARIAIAQDAVQRVLSSIEEAPRPLLAT